MANTYINNEKLEVGEDAGKSITISKGDNSLITVPCSNLVNDKVTELENKLKEATDNGKKNINKFNKYLIILAKRDNDIIKKVNKAEEKHDKKIDDVNSRLNTYNIRIINNYKDIKYIKEKTDKNTTNITNLIDSNELLSDRIDNLNRKVINDENRNSKQYIGIFHKFMNIRLLILIVAFCWFITTILFSIYTSQLNKEITELKEKVDIYYNIENMSGNADDLELRLSSGSGKLK